MAITFGTPPSARWRSSRPPRSPVTGSVWGSSANGIRWPKLGVNWSEGWAKRWLNSPRRAAGDVEQHAVEDLPAVLVQVEAEVEEVAQEAPALRDAVAVGPLDAAGARVAGVASAVAQEGRKSRTASRPVPTTGQVLVR